jgi:hypothetical protein
MDFRNVVVDRLNWTVSLGKLTNRIKVAYGGGGKLEFQTPMLTVDIQAVPRFPAAFEMSVIDEIHDDFISFVDDIEVGAKVAIRELVAGKRFFSSRKFTAFNDSKVFDVDGDVIENMHQRPGKYNVAMMLQLDGAWVSERSWGIKFKVTEIQIFSMVVLDIPKPKIQVLRDGIQVQKNLFIADDDDDGAGAGSTAANKKMIFLDDD